MAYYLVQEDVLREHGIEPLLEDRALCTLSGMDIAIAFHLKYGKELSELEDEDIDFLFEQSIDLAEEEYNHGEKWLDDLWDRWEERIKEDADEEDD